MGLVIPGGRRRGVALLDAAVDEDRQQPVEIGGAPEQPLDAIDHLFLAERIRRHGGGQGPEARSGWHGTALPDCRAGPRENRHAAGISSPPARAAASRWCEPL